MKKISQPTKITHHQISCTPIPELGETFEGFYHKGKKAIKKLLQEKRGQKSQKTLEIRKNRFILRI